MASPAKGKVVGSLLSTRKWVEPAPVKVKPADEKVEAKSEGIDLSPICKSLDRLAEAVLNQQAPQVTVEPVVNVAAPVIPVQAPRSYVVKVTRDSRDLATEYRIDPVSTLTQK